MTKQEFLKTILELNNQSVKVFSDMVDQIETTEPENDVVKITPGAFKSIATDIVHAIVNAGKDLVNDYELSLNYNNQLELEDVSIDESEVDSIVVDILSNYFEVED